MFISAWFDRMLTIFAFHFIKIIDKYSMVHPTGFPIGLICSMCLSHHLDEHYRFCSGVYLKCNGFNFICMFIYLVVRMCRCKQ